MQRSFSFLSKLFEYISLAMMIFFIVGHPQVSCAGKPETSDADVHEEHDSSRRCLVLVPYVASRNEVPESPTPRVHAVKIDRALAAHLLTQQEARERAQLIFAHNHLVRPSIHHFLEEFVTYVARPNFYALTTADGTFANIFVFPTNHLVPGVALPPYICDALVAMASWPKLHVIKEVGEDFYGLKSSQALYEKIRRHRDYKLDRKALSVAEIEYLWKVTVSSPLTEEQLEIKAKEIEERGTEYANWFLELDEKAQASLLYMYKKNNFPDQDALQRGDLNPKIILACIEYAARTGNKKGTPYWQLDDEVEALFLQEGRHVFTALETQKDRTHAMVEGLLSLKFNMDFQWQLIIQGLNRHLLQRDSLRSCEEVGSPYEIRHGCLGDLACDKLTYAWMHGNDTPSRGSAPSALEIAVEARNNLWWERTIERLVDDRLAERESTPVLLLYGSAHNDGKTGILPRMVREKHMRFFNLTRDGWREGNISQFLG